MLWLQKTFESIKNAARAALQNPMQLVSVLGFVLCCVAGVWMWRAGLLGSRAALQAFLEPFGPWAAALFVLFQAVQVVVPILPGGLGWLCCLGRGGGLCIIMSASVQAAWPPLQSPEAAGGRCCTRCSRAA